MINSNIAAIYRPTCLLQEPVQGKEFCIIAGEKYEGFFVNKKLHGEGRVTNAQTGTLCRVGIFDQGVFLRGILVKGNQQHMGRFLNDQLEGRGVIKSADLFERGLFKKGELIKGERITREGCFLGDLIEGTFTRILAVSSMRHSLGMSTVIRLKNGVVKQISDHNTCLKTLINISLSSTDPSIRELHNKYGGLVNKDHAHFRAKAVRDFFEQTLQKPIRGALTQAEKEGLARLVRHRTNFSNYTDLFSHPEPQEIRLQIQKDLQELSDPQSQRVIKLENGTSFVIPGGCIGHAITYEFQKKANHYYFLIHNTGDGLENSRIHSAIEFTDRKRKYVKITVTFETSLEGLMDGGFIDALIRRNQDMNQVYDAIYKHFITEQKGKIVVTDRERVLTIFYVKYCLTEAHLHKEAIKQEALAVIRGSQEFGRSQLYSTCAESSARVAEKNMAPRLTRKALRFFTLKRLVEKASKEILPQNMKKDSDFALTQVRPLLNRLKEELEEKEAI